MHKLAGGQVAGRDPFLQLRGELHERWAECGLVGRLRPTRYDPGDVLRYEVTGAAPATTGSVEAEVERFVGGGFAGQVYRIRLLEAPTGDRGITGLEAGGVYALKILKPPSGFANLFRDLLYGIGFQSAFSPRVEPAAVRVGVCWQKLIRRAMELETGDAGGVCDTYATLYDADLASFGEINEWVDGRIWKFEVDDRLFERWSFSGEPPPDQAAPEYVHKKLFMRRLVALLHEMGAPELARQYEWWSLKSQPNALKRVASEDGPEKGLTAIDFRAGLTLLPFLPMSPVDVRLILGGLLRGSLVQFDRADLPRLRRFLAERREDFEDLAPVVAELEEREGEYRRSMPDLTHQGLRLLVDGDLRRSVKRGRVTAWQSLGRIDRAHADRLLSGRWLFRLLLLVSWVPLLGRLVIRLWGDDEARRHASRCVRDPGYLLRAMRGARIGILIDWARQGRVGPEAAHRLVDRPLRYWLRRLTVSWLPPNWQRFLSEPSWAWARIRDGARFGMRFLRQPEFREEVLCEQVRLGESEGMLTTAEAQRILGQVKDPYIQKYLRFLAVHMCTVPVTQVTMLLVGAAVVAYCLTYRGMSWPESLALGSAAAASIQLLPISPGSLTRGVFVLFLMIKERDIRSYWVAAPISFLHVIGYLAFPLQMVTHNPALARFLAGRWTVSTVRLVPVFGERGALVEHAIFDALFNAPISAARGFRRRPLRWIAGILLVVSLLGALFVAGVARIWEWRQPPQTVESAVIESAVPNCGPLGDLGLVSCETRARITGLEGEIEFSASRWDPSIAEGDTVRVVVRRSAFGADYDGLEISGGAPSPR